MVLEISIALEFNFCIIYMDNALDFQCLSKLVLDFLIFGDSIASWSSIWFLFYRVMNNALDFIPQIHLYIFSFFEINIDLRLKDSSLLEIFLSYSFQQVKGFFFMTNLSTFSLIFRIFVTLSPLYIIHSFSNF